MSTKISIIGAGSANFSLDLLRDIIMTRNLHDCSICLMDIDETRLEGIYQLCLRYMQELDLHIRLERTTDRIAALRNAEYVICVALAAGHDRLREGWRIAYEHGYRFGGSYHIVHDEAFWVNFYQLKLIESVQQDILEICPNAWHILISNPVMAAVTYLTRTYPKAKVAGLCNGTSTIYSIIREMGLNREDVEIEMSGLNHYVWVTRFTCNGENAFPLLDRWIEDKFPEYIKQRPRSNGVICSKSIALYQMFGALPLGDTFSPGGGSWPYWFHTSDELEEHWYEAPLKHFGGYFKRGEEELAKIRALVDNRSARVVDQYPLKPSGDFIVQLLESLICDIPRVYMVNMQNHAYFVPGIPADFQVEIPAKVSKQGIQGIHTNGLPKAVLANALHSRVAPVELELEAFATGDRNLLLNLILMDPFSTTRKNAEHLLEAIFALPYHAELRNHFK